MRTLASSRGWWPRRSSSWRSMGMQNVRLLSSTSVLPANVPCSQSSRFDCRLVLRRLRGRRADDLILLAGFLWLRSLPRQRRLGWRESSLPHLSRPGRRRLSLTRERTWHPQLLGHRHDHRLLSLVTFQALCPYARRGVFSAFRSLSLLSRCQLRPSWFAVHFS